MNVCITFKIGKYILLTNYYKKIFFHHFKYLKSIIEIFRSYSFFIKYPLEDV